MTQPQTIRHPSGSTEPLLSVRDLRVTFQRHGEKAFRAVDGVSFDVRPGQTVGLVGESGCGKSVTSLAIMGLLPERGNTVEGSAIFDGEDLLSFSRSAMRDRRGADIAMIFQDPLSSLNPVVTIGRQVTEVMERHRGMSRKEATPKAVELLERVGIPDPRARLVNYPHQLSGGMRQRALIAMALACSPRLLIADEPTTALDVTIQAQILALLKELVVDTGTALVMITHDLGVVAGLCDEVNVLYGGKIVERGGRHGLVPAPAPPVHRRAAELDPAARRTAWREADTGARLRGRQPPVGLGVRVRAALPQRPGRLHAGEARVGRRPGRRLPLLQPDGRTAVSETARTTVGEPSDPSSDVLVEVTGLEVYFPIKSGLLFDRTVGHVRAVDGVDLSIRRGETYGLVGESGCGKSTLGKAILNLEPPTAGSVVLRRRRHLLPEGRGTAQGAQALPDGVPGPALQPGPAPDRGVPPPEGMGAHGLDTDKVATRTRLRELMSDVGLPVAALSKYPHEFSGGQRQRIGIARALLGAARPDRRGRAGERPRRVHPGTGHQLAPGPPGQARPDLPRRRARPRRGPTHQRPDRRDVPRRPGGGVRRGGALRRTAPPLHPGAHVRRARARPAWSRTRASRSCSPATCPRRPTRRPAAASTPGARGGRRRGATPNDPSCGSSTCPARPRSHRVACHFAEQIASGALERHEVERRARPDGFTAGPAGHGPATDAYIAP